MVVRFTSLEADIRQADIIEQYGVGPATVYITSDGRYLVQEPPLSPREHEIYLQIADRMGKFPETRDGAGDGAGRMHLLEERIWKEARRMRKSDRVSEFFGVLRYHVLRNTSGYGPLEVPVSDPHVGEIFVDGSGIEVAVTHRNHQNLGLLDTNIVVGGGTESESLAAGLARKVGLTAPSRPITDGITIQKHRVTMAYASAVPADCPAITISKFQASPPTIADLLRQGTLSGLEAAYLWMLNDACAFGVILGGRGSGKTTLLNSIASMSNPGWRVVTIEGARRLQVPHRHAIAFDIGPLDGPGRLAQLARASRWMRPDLLLVDDLPQEEAHEVFRCAQNGHAVMASMNLQDADSPACMPWADAPARMPCRTMPWYAVSMGHFRPPGGGHVRRIASLAEFDPSRKAPSKSEPFSGGLAAAEGHDGIEAVLKKSRLVGHAAKLLAVNPAEDLQSRMALLGECLEKKADKTHDVFEILKKYYAPAPARPSCRK